MFTSVLSRPFVSKQLTVKTRQPVLQHGQRFAPNVQTRDISFCEVGRTLDSMKARAITKLAVCRINVDDIMRKFNFQFDDNKDTYNYKQHSQLVEKYIKDGKLTVDISTEAKIFKLNERENEYEQCRKKYFSQKTKAKLMFFGFICYDLYFFTKTGRMTDFDAFMATSTLCSSVFFALSAVNQCDNETGFKRSVEETFQQICTPPCKCKPNCQCKTEKID